MIKGGRFLAYHYGRPAIEKEQEAAFKAAQ